MNSIASADPVPLFGPEMLADPYPIYRTLLAKDPVYWSERHEAWIVTGYDAVAAGLNDLRLSSARAEAFRKMANNPELDPYFDFLKLRMVLADPPRHTRLRGLVTRVFTPHVVEAMRPHIQQLVDGFLEAAAPKGRMDLIADFAFPLPASVIMEMLGLPPQDRMQFKKWSDDIVAYFTNHPASVPMESYRLAVRSMNEMLAYFRAAMPAIRKRGDAGLLAALEKPNEQGDRLTDEEIYANANLLLIAGHETTTHLIGNGVYALLNAPDQLAKLKADPTLIPGAIEEILRRDGPVQFTNRMAAEDVTLGGKSIKKGQLVFLFLAAANRDPARFPDPDRLDLARTDHKHLALGQGHHFCVGAPLARLEAQVAFTTLWRRFPGLKLADEKPVRSEILNLHGFKSLPVMLG